MAKRSVERAVRDEVAEAEKALERANLRLIHQKGVVTAALDGRKLADEAVSAASDRLKRAEASLAALVPLPAPAGEEAAS